MDNGTFKLILLDWHGPFSLDELNLLNDISQDYGINQIYGKHTVYGKDVLIYMKG